MMSPEGHYLDFSSTDNTLNVNSPLVAQFVVDSPHYFVQEFHIDGSRFDLASCLTLDTDGTTLSTLFVMHMISEDLLLKEVKLIAEPWNAAGSTSWAISREGLAGLSGTANTAIRK